MAGETGALRWIKENEFVPRYPFWTRANVSEVLPEPPSPLGWDMVWEGAAVSGWRDLFLIRMGMGVDELSADRCEAIGIWGGYAYLGAALFRVWAGRVPGMKPTTIDEAYFGEHPDVPPYVHEPWHDRAETTEKMTEWLGQVTVGLDQSELERDREESIQLRTNRPDFASMSDAALFGFALAQRPLLRRMFNQHINQSVGASVGPGILGTVCAAIGQPTWAMRLMTGLGGVDSAAPSYRMWALSRTARTSAPLTALFDAGTVGLYARLQASADPSVTAFAAEIDQFLVEFGSRGANEWDLIAPVWEVNPDTALAAIDRMRQAADTASPIAENASREAERLDLTAKVRAALAGNDEALGGFEVGLASASTFLPGRERSKTAIIRVLHEVRMAMLELGRRLAGRGTLAEPTDIFMLFVDELGDVIEGYLPDIRQQIPARHAHRAYLASLEPPFIINGRPDPLSEWHVRGARPVELLRVGDVLTGVQGCPGKATGRARVILDPSDPLALEPGDILVAPVTDPSWTPLFVPAGAVVVDVGAALSHAVIVSRELGIPCVASAVDATRRIPDGAIIEVDGDAATVTVLSLPS